MSNLNWPEGATHYLDAGDEHTRFRDLSGEKWKFFNALTGQWSQHYFSSEGLLSRRDLIPRPQPKPWSGPEDGLPPIGARCRVVKIDGIDAPLDTECKIVAHEMNGENMVAVYMHGKAYAMYVGIGISDCFSLAKSPDKRETAIRELMDIAQVDCRVTAARLVDAGFKR